MDARTDVPAPANEPIHEYAPHSAERTRLVAALRDLSANPIDLPHVIAGAHRMGDGERIDVVQPHRHSAKLGTLTNATHADATAAVEAAMAAKARVGRHAVRRARRGVPARRRSARRALARDDRRRDHARPVQDRLPGRDRRALRARRLLAVQRRLRPRDPGSAAHQLTRGVEPQRLPAAGRLRLRRHPVQLHRHRRQPADRARADGQHGGVEAVGHPELRGVPDDAAPRGGRPAAGRHQPGRRRRVRDLRGRARRPSALRYPLHRFDGHLPASVA